MAAINFPDPNGQTPINTFSPTSTPAATLNGLTYEWTNGSWSIVDNNTVTAAPNLQKVTDIGNQTTNDIVTDGAISAATIAGDVIASVTEVEEGVVTDKVVTPAALAAALGNDGNSTIGTNEVGYLNWKQTVRRGQLWDGIWYDEDRILLLGVDASGSYQATIDFEMYYPRLGYTEPMKSKFPITTTALTYTSTDTQRGGRIYAPKGDINPDTKTVIIAGRNQSITTSNRNFIYRCEDPADSDAGWVDCLATADPVITSHSNWGVNDVVYVGGNVWIAGFSMAVNNYTGYGYYSTDDGVSWTRVTSSGDYYQPGYMPKITRNGDILVSSMGGFRTNSAGATRENNFFLSGDAGRSWSQLDTNQSTAALKEVNDCIITNAGTLLYSSYSNTGLSYRSTNNGLSWVEMKLPGLTQWGYVFEKDNQGNVYALQNKILFNNDRGSASHTSKDEHAGFIYKSEDDGLTWTVVQKAVQWNGPRDSTYTAMLVSPDGLMNLTATESYGSQSGIAFPTNSIIALGVSTSSYSRKDCEILNGVVPFFQGFYNAVPTDAFSTTFSADEASGFTAGEDEPIAVNGYYPLYTTVEGAEAAGDGGYHTHTFDGTDYYMPDGTEIYHGDYSS